MRLVIQFKINSLKIFKSSNHSFKMFHSKSSLVFIQLFTFLCFISHANCNFPVLAREFKFYEGNMDKQMEGETISHAARLIDASHDKVIDSLADQMAQHLSQEFNGTWHVMV